MRIVALTAAAILAVACDDPVLKARAASLGPDEGAYAEGPYHRAGDACTFCHTKGGGAASFDLGGTIYAQKDSAEPLPGVQVRFFDASGRQLTLESNQAGNFFLPGGELDLEFPLWVKLEHQGEVTAMQSPIFRERSCAACHSEPRSPSSAGRVFFEENE